MIDAIGSAKVSTQTERKKDIGLSQKKTERNRIERGK
tara:strand:+ start:40 stop:150 length:111 start_codon:yes stop_codon:yes gene_type:complete